MNPVVSVVIPTFNYGHYIRECLDSLVTQRFPEFEAIVVDDCSTDGTFDVLSGNLPDQRFRLQRQERNQGASVARNTGVEMARAASTSFSSTRTTCCCQVTSKRWSVSAARCRGLHFSAATAN